MFFRTRYTEKRATQKPSTRRRWGAINNKMNKSATNDGLHYLRRHPTPPSCRTRMSAGKIAVGPRHDSQRSRDNENQIPKRNRVKHTRGQNSYLLPTTAGITNNMLNVDTRGVVSQNPNKAILASISPSPPHAPVTPPPP